MKSYFFCLIFLTAFLAFAQKKALNDIDFFKVPRKYETNIDSLASYFNQTYKEDSMKIKAIYVWVALNIRYDYYLYNNIKTVIRIQDANRVFNKKEAVCEGYSNLFSYLCDKCNISNEKIHGLAYVNKYNEVFKVEDSRHAWNAAKINGKWYLYDVTWSSNYFEYKNKLGYDFWYYFQTDPYLFSSSHLPNDPIWQLRNKIINYPDWLDRKESSFIRIDSGMYNFDFLIGNNQKLKGEDKQIESLRRSRDFFKNNTLKSLEINKTYYRLILNNCYEWFNDVVSSINDYERLVYKKNNRTVYSSLKIDLFVNDSFLQNQKSIFNKKYKILDSIQNLLSEADFYITDTSFYYKVVKLKHYLNREQICLDRFINFSKFRRSDGTYRPLYSKWFIENYYTKTYEADFYEREMNFCFFINLANISSLYGNVSAVDYLGSLDVGFGYIYKKYTFKFVVDLMMTNNPVYLVNYNGSLQKSRSGGSSGFLIQADYKYFRGNRFASFLSSSIGFNELTQYSDINSKTNSNNKVNSYSPYFSVGNSITYRFNIMYYCSLNSNVIYLNHGTNLGQDLSGFVYQVGLGFGIGGNKLW